MSRYCTVLSLILSLFLTSLPALGDPVTHGQGTPPGRPEVSSAVFEGEVEAGEIDEIHIIYWTGLGDGSSWGDPLNWEPSEVPGPTHAAIVAAEGSPTIVLDERAVVWGLAIIRLGGVPTLRIEADTLTLARVGINFGTIRIFDGGYLEVGPPTVLRNFPDGLIELFGGDVIGEGSLVNSGQIVKLEEPTLRATLSRIDCDLLNQGDDPADGAIRVADGTLQFTGSFANEGSLTVDDMAQMGGGGKNSTPTFSNSGVILLPENGELNLVDGAVLLENTYGGVLNFQGGDLTGAGTLANLGLVTKTGAKKSRINTSKIDAGFLNMSDDPGDGAITVDDGTLEVLGETVNDGTIDVGGGGTLEAGGAAPFAQRGIFTNTGKATIHPGGTWIQLGSLSNAIGGEVHNAGLLQIAEAGEWMNDGKTFVEEGAELTNLGLFHLRENSLLGGSGLVESSTGSFLNEGIIQPGASTGILTFNGDFNQTEMSEIVFELGGTAEGEHDRLVIGGNATLNGAIHARLVNGYVPQLDDEFEVIVISTGDKDARSFGCYSGLDLPGGLHLEPQETPDIFSFVVIGSASGNMPPRARDDYFAGNGEAPIHLPVLRNDTDPEGADLRVVPVVTATENGGGVLLDAGDSTLTYVPMSGFSGIDRFRYIATDCVGGSDSAYVSVYVARPHEAVEEGELAGKAGPAEETEAGGKVLFLPSPNPARGAVSLRYGRIPSGPADLSVYDVSGRLVRSLSLSGPSGVITWDGRTESGRDASPGVYFLRLQTAEGGETRRVLLVR